MDEDKEHYGNFLKLCLTNGLTVWADSGLLASHGTPAHWHGNDHISVYRPSEKINFALKLVPGHSTEDEIKQFIDASPNIKLEMALLLHEYGHWSSKHPHLSRVHKTIAYQNEVEAWDKGKEVGHDCGVKAFSVFDSEREKALKGYREGLGLK